MLRTDPRECPEQRGLVLRPRRARDQCRRASAEPKQWLVLAHAGDPLDHAVVARVAQHSNAVGGNPESGQALGILLRNRGGHAHRLVARSEYRSRRPAEPAATRTHRGRHHRDGRPTGRGANSQLGPEIELREDEEVGPERAQQRLHRAREVVGEIIGDVDRKPAGERLGGGTEVGVDELSVGATAAQLVEHALRLQPLADRRSVQPDERPSGITLPGAPRREALDGTVAPPMPGGELGTREREHRRQAARHPGGRPVERRRGRHRRSYLPSARCPRGGQRTSLWQAFMSHPATEEVIHCLQSQGSPAAANIAARRAQATLTWGGRHRRPLFLWGHLPWDFRPGLEARMESNTWRNTGSGCAPGMSPPSM